jgi:hypothetical protein
MRIDQVQALIMQETAIPLPYDYSEIIDCTEWWGRSVWPQWEQEILHEFYIGLRNGDFQYATSTKEQLFHDCIAILVSKEVSYSYSVASATHITIMQEFQRFFYDMYERSTHDFYVLAVHSQVFARNKVQEHQAINQAMTVVVGTIIPDEVSSIETRDSF